MKMKMNRPDDHIPSFHDAVGAFWDLVGYKQRSTECEEWHRKVNEWNIPDPSDIAVLVITSAFTQPVYYVVDSMSITMESFFSRQSVLVTILIFMFVAYVIKLLLTQHKDFQMHQTYAYIPTYEDMKMAFRRQ
jgi:hypothetical protein